MKIARSAAGKVVKVDGMVFVLNGKQFYVVEEMCVIYGNQNVYLALLGSGAARARNPTKMRFWQCRASLSAEQGTLVTVYSINEQNSSADAQRRMRT